MKYGYLLYKKPLIAEMPDRPVNLGDPIQSYAVKLLYKEMGIKDEDIIPVPRYDLTNYDGEECVCVVNTCSTYEELAYDSHFMPPSSKIHAIPFSLHLNREIPGEEIEFYKNCEDVGCRDIFSVNELKKYGVHAYLTGCLTLTFPRRAKELDVTANDIYLIDVQSDFQKLIPEEIRKNAKTLSSICRFPITHDSNRMTMEEAMRFHQLGEERIELLKNNAKLVITSRLHAAAPCLAMGIPVILTRHDDRFGFIDCFIKSYTNWEKDCIDWNPKPVNIEKEKQIIKEMFFARIQSAVKKIELNNMWELNMHESNIVYEPEVRKDLENANFPKDKPFKYAILGVISSTSYFIPGFMKEIYPNSELVCGIDSYVKNDFFGKKVIKPYDISILDSDVIVITAVKGAYAVAKEFLTNRPHVVIAGKKVCSINL